MLTATYECKYIHYVSLILFQFWILGVHRVPVLFGDRFDQSPDSTDDTDI